MNQIQPTTALRKISGLKKRIWGIQGGQGAGKTFAIIIILINHAKENPGKEIFIASDELSKMRITIIKDFVNIMMSFKIFTKDRWLDGTLYKFANGSFIKFIGLDKADIGKGLRCDVMFVNEANKIKFDTFRELTARAKRVIVDFNPNKRFWFHNEIMIRTDCDFLKLTYLDNEYLGSTERSEILGYKTRGYDDKGKVINSYWANMWRVYGLGEIGQVEGRIYHWTKIPFDQYLQMKIWEQFYIDFGKVDPCAIGGMKYHDGNLYLDERNYASENELERSLNEMDLHKIRGLATGGEKNSGLMPWLLNKIGIPYNARIICENQPHKILSLRHAGWENAKAVGSKPTIENRVSILSSLNIFYTDRSKNIEYEQENYCYAKDRNGVTLEQPVDQDNHHMDGASYGVFDMFKEGVIKNI